MIRRHNIRTVKKLLLIVLLITGIFLIKHLDARARETLGQESLRPATAKTVALPALNELLQPVEPGAQPVAINTLNSAPPIRVTSLISIPYGFDTPLPIMEAGREVVASGHGGCTAGEQVTVAITITQSTSGAMATGETDDTCNGELQFWNALASTVTTSDFTADAAEACGLATTSDDGYVTDTYAWCRDVDLIAVDPWIFLPIVTKP